MKKRNYLDIIIIIFWVTFLFVFLFCSTNCATTRGSSIEDQRHGYMLNDKSEYSRNKGKFKSGGTYDRQYKKNLKKIKKQQK